MKKKKKRLGFQRYQEIMDNAYYEGLKEADKLPGIKQQNKVFKKDGSPRITGISLSSRMGKLMRENPTLKDTMREKMAEQAKADLTEYYESEQGQEEIADSPHAGKSAEEIVDLLMREVREEHRRRVEYDENCPLND